ncbi:MAG: septum site-determining protein MinC [Nitrosomonas sp.]|nr:septum site-determining protein MinC [Nitrosomonas sp.]
MPTSPQNKPVNTTPVLEFKSGTFFAPILMLFNHDITAIEISLQEKIRLAPDFFKNAQLIIDVSELNRLDFEIDITVIVNLLRNIGLFPIGIHGGNEQQNKQARLLFIPTDTATRTYDNQISLSKTQLEDSAKKSLQSVAEESVLSAIPLPNYSAATTLITQPVRSGQRIYAAGDLIVMSQVSAGAEIMAEGNIHVYNTLRGRALAGVQGRTDARIFCYDLQAELISIAGDYKTSEDLNKQARKKPVQIYLQDHALIFQEIA